LITGIAFGILMLELLVLPGPASALTFEGGLRSRLSANYGMDPIAARIHELRLTIVEDVLGMGDGDSSEPPAIALLMQDPVPAVPSATSPATDPTASPVPTDAVPTETSLPAPTETPPPPTAVAAPIEYCGNLSIFDMKVDDGDDVEARVRNSGSKHVYLIKTVFEWPDVPVPGYLDWFKFDGDRYHHPHDGDSPTIWIWPGDPEPERLRRERTEKWETDFDDVPDGMIYGSFSVTLTFNVPGQDAHCTISGSTFRAPPSPTPEPTDIPVPTDTPTSTPTDIPEPTEVTPEPTQTATVTPITPEPTTPIS
jgi:hypothetical protein